jgi:large-conductance mechanosensitive channel
MSEYISSAIKNTEKVVNTIDNKFNIGVFHFVNLIQSQIVGLIKFLIEKNIIQMGIGLLLAAQVGHITKMLQDVIISPIVNRLTFGHVKKLEDLKHEMFGIEFKTGSLLVTLINLIFVIVLVYYIWKLTQLEDFKFISDFFEGLKPKLNNEETKINISILGAPIITSEEPINLPPPIPSK